MSFLRLAYTFILLLGSLTVSAFHIVGGELTYTHLGGEAYEVTLTVYRDCFSAGAPFDDPASVGVFNGDGSLYDTFTFNDPFVTPVETTVDFACTDITASACVEKGVYVEVIFLPASTQGYYLAYQRCCRNTTIQNLTNPEEFGATYTAFIPSVDIAASNSNPVFSDIPPVGLCQNLPFTFDHSATDIDGDSLVYEFCTPYHGANQDSPQPAVPSPPPWSNIVWGPGFDAENQITSGPGFTIDPQTGFMQGTPTQIGQFVIGVCVREYRDGVLLSEGRRDFQFNVVACPTAALASFVDLSQGEYCEGVGIQFENQSANATNFLWDFGDTQTSTLFAPFHDFVGVGEYTVTLISDPGEACADTATSVYIINPVPAPIILEPELNCPGNTYDITVSGLLDNVTDYAWTIESPQGPSFNTGPILSEVGFDAPGLTYIEVTVTNTDNCSGSDIYPFTVPDPPVAAIEPIPDPCQGLTLEFQSLSQYANDLDWDFGGLGLADNSDVANPTFEYAQSGAYTVSLTAFSNVACNDITTMLVEANPPLEVSFMGADPQCLEANEFALEAEGNFTNNANFTWSFENSEIGVIGNQDTGPFSFAQEGTYEVALVVTEGPCEAQYWDYITVVEELQADFITESAGCAPYDAAFIDLTTGGASLAYTWTFGDGGSSTHPGSVSHDYPNPGSYDVSLTVESTYGCPDLQTITLPAGVVVAPSPHADFELDPPNADINESVVQFTSTATGNTECVFLVEGSTPYEICDFEHEFTSGGQYEVTQVVYNEYGCEDRVSTIYTVNGHAFYAANAITMNSDDINDFFKPSINGDIVEYELVIFDRWGKTLFKTYDINQPWVPEYGEIGMHSYQVNLRDAANIRKRYSGVFSVIR